MKFPAFLSRLIVDSTGKFRYETTVFTFWAGSIVLSLAFLILFSAIYFMTDSILLKKTIIFQSILLGFLTGTFGAWYLFAEKTELKINLGLTDWKWLRFLKGFAISGSLIILVYLLFSLLGWIQISFFPATQSLPAVAQGMGVLIILTLVPTVSEELMFRGFPLQVNSRQSDRLSRIVFLSVIFSLLHFNVAGVSAVSFLNFFLLGVWFSYGNLAEGTVWYSSGLHFGWNFIQTAVFGLSAREMGIPGQSLATLEFSGPDWVTWLTGTGNGVENGVVISLIIALLIRREYLRTL